MPMKNPVHPGRIVRYDCLEPLGLSVTAGVKALGVTRQAINRIVNGKSGISPEMAIPANEGIRQHGGDVVAAATSHPENQAGGRLQLAYDLAATRKNESKIKVRRRRGTAEQRG